MQMQNLGIKNFHGNIYRWLALPALGLRLLNLSPKRREEREGREGREEKIKKRGK
jgi:hypothetical protein